MWPARVTRHTYTAQLGRGATSPPRPIEVSVLKAGLSSWLTKNSSERIGGVRDADAGSDRRVGGAGYPSLYISPARGSICAACQGQRHVCLQNNTAPDQNECVWEKGRVRWAISECNVFFNTSVRFILAPRWTCNRIRDVVFWLQTIFCARSVH